MDHLYDVIGHRFRVSEGADDLVPILDVNYANYKVRESVHPIAPSSVTTKRDASTRDAMDVALELSDEPASPSHYERLIWEGEIDFRLSGKKYIGSDRDCLEVDGIGFIEFDRREKVTRIRVSKSNPRGRSLIGFFAMHMICFGMTEQQACWMHAASCVTNVRGKQESILVVAPSMTGKTTTILSLANAGFPLMGDDISFLRRLPQNQLELGVWGLPRDCHVRKPTFALVPWLREIENRYSKSSQAYKFRHRDLGARSIAADKPVPIAMVVCLEKPNTTAHEIRRLAPSEALVRVALESIHYKEDDGERSARDFSLLAELVNSHPVVALSVGADPASVGATIESFLCK